MIDRFLFYKNKNISGYSLGWESSEITLNINEQQLQGWFAKTPNYTDTPVIIYYGGNAEDVSIQLGDLVPPLSMSFLLMNYRGFGKSTGNPTQKNLFSDALKIYDFLVKEHKIDPDKICLVGRSIGSSIAAYVASQRPVKKLVLVTPFDTPANVIPKSFFFFPLKKCLERYFNTAQYLEQFSGQFLVIAAANDEIIPKRCTENLLEKFQNQILFVNIKEANHQDINDYSEYFDAIEKYIVAPEKVACELQT